MSHNDNLFVALRDAFPAERSRTAIETADGPGAPLFYTWADLERGTAMIANLLASLQLPSGARVAVQTEKSVEALLLYLAVLRAGYVFLPRQHQECGQLHCLPWRRRSGQFQRARRSHSEVRTP